MSRAFFAKHGITLRLTCPYTSQQNGHAERILRTLNDGLRTLMFEASLPPSFWPDALATSTYLLNRRPCRPRHNSTLFELLFGTPPDYAHLRVFGCLCYPNTAATAPHKLASRSARCIFLGYPMDQRGYKCYNPKTKRVIISRHVYFDESCFPFVQLSESGTGTATQCPPCIQDVVLTPTVRRPRTHRAQHLAPQPSEAAPTPPSPHDPGTSKTAPSPSAAPQTSPTTQDPSTPATPPGSTDPVPTSAGLDTAPAPALTSPTTPPPTAP